MPQSVMPPFNNGLPLTVVRVPSEWEGEADRLGVIDEANYRVWIEHDLGSTRVGDVRAMETVALPSMPSHYGEWKRTSIGGVSKTVRRINIVRAGSRVGGPVVVFAVLCPHESAVSELLRSKTEVCSVGDPQHVDDEHGIVTEVVVFDPGDLAHVCALVSKAGATVMLEDPSANARRCLGVERLDRIGAEVVCDDDMYEENDGVYGLRRGIDNWQFPYLPKGWRVPITWDHMVDNVIDAPLTDIPHPLRQHVAKRRLDKGMHLKVGSRWVETVPRTQEEESAPEAPEFRRVLESPSEALTSWIRCGNPEGAELPDDVPDLFTLNTIVQVDGTWYRPVDTTAVLKKHKTDACGKRRVSAALKDTQSRQLLTAFYYLCIDRSEGNEVLRAFALVMFHYMKERGYTARWMGKYEQQAMHIGNGDGFRHFNRLSAYDPHRLPATVLNKLCGTDGKLKSRGSKGTRSKFKSDKKRYEPKRRLHRTKWDEERMVE